jgi:hypothetical protein
MQTRKIILVALAIIVCAGTFWRIRSRSTHYEEAYTGDRHVILWSSTAQVREQLATLGYGERLEILRRFGDDVEVRTAQGLTGWVDAKQLLSSELWHRATELAAQATAMPVQARGHTKAVSNLRVEPGRDGARIVQLGRDVPVEFMRRQVVEAPAAGSGAKDDEDASPRREDWWLVRAQSKDSGDVSGWVLGRFVALDLPSPLPDYASSGGMHVIAWFELNRVPDPSGEKRQYLVAGARGGEGQPCDFTLLRVYTWSSARRRYETAYVESNLCGKLPIRVTPAAALGGDASFRFAASDKSGGERVYQMHQTVVRRIRQGETPHAQKHARHR